MNRYYANTAGRFHSVDPGTVHLWSPKTWNRYVYVLNDPVNSRDPSGLECNADICVDVDAPFPPETGKKGPGPIGGDDKDPIDEGPQCFSAGMCGGQQGGPPITTGPDVDHGYQLVRNALTADSNCDNWFRTSFANSIYSAGSTFDQFLGYMNLLTGITQLAAGENANYNAQRQDFLILINTTGAYFQAGTVPPSGANNQAYFNAMVGGSNRAKGFILLHELAHALNMINRNDSGRTGVQDANQRANNDSIYSHCNQGLNTLSNTGP